MAQEEVKVAGEILKTLFQYCTDKATGTFMVVTGDNTACNVVIKYGALSKARFGTQFGLDALVALKKLDQGRVSFLKSLVMPMDVSATLKDSDKALSLLGFGQKTKTPEAPQVKSEPVPKKKRTEKKLVSMYRGQAVYEEVEIDDAESVNDTSEDSAPKKQRMYRGQLIDE